LDRICIDKQQYQNVPFRPERHFIASNMWT